MSETVSIKIQIPVQTLRDLLCTAVEQGSGYWANFSHMERTPNLDYLRVKVSERESHDSGKAHVLYVQAEDLAIGIEKLAAIAFAEDGAGAAHFPAAGKHFSDALDNHDAETADVVLQMTVFGELIYG
jgi:hypothetical protein